uniref:Sugar transferase n=1 Tax=candidate division WOR-3 bacterium TaxID=2052148 RepID=A0A7C4TAK0_UNCW3
MPRKLEFIITISGDAILICLIFIISWKASFINSAVTNSHAIIANLGLLLYWLFLFQTFDLYQPRSRIQFINGVAKLFQTIVIGLLILISSGYLMNINFIKASGFVPSYCFAMGSVLIWRMVWWGIWGELFKKRAEPVLIFKNGESEADYPGFKVLKEIKFNEINPDFTEDIFKENKFEGILIESNGQNQEAILKLITQFAETNQKIFITPKLYPLVYQEFLINKIPDSPFLQIIFHPLSNWDRFLKRLTDVFLSTILLLVLSPIMILIALLIKIESRGPIIYKQKRVGLRGKIFYLYKFRSMIQDAEKYTGPVWAKKNDKRITRLGRILRPFRLDELPQLFNVLVGDMSFVGPRPERPHFVAKFINTIPFYRLRHIVHPGITGLAQVKYSYDRNIEDVKKKLTFDLEYINNISLKLDLKIFLKTILTVLKREGAH